MKQTFPFTITLSLLLMLGFKAEAVWTIVPSPNADALDNVLLAQYGVSPYDIWAVGWYNDVTGTHPLAIHWDGTQWTHVTLPDSGGNNSWLSTVIAIASNDVWAFGSDSNLLRGLAYHWNGSSWSQVSVPAVGQSSSISGAYAAASNQIWAVGSYQHNGTHWYTMILYWNGLSWVQVTSPNKCTGTT